jgi:tRNA A-37 threonylcarbamoyl transferase component Bud32
MNRDLVQAYLAGRLPPEEGERVARAIDALSEDEAARLLDDGPRPDASNSAPPAPAPAFTPALRSFTPGAGLGQGATGEVVAAEDRLLHRAVALKRLRARGAGEELHAFLARGESFRREAALTASLEHPGVVPVHDIGSGPHGEPAFAMKRLDGEPLADLLRRAPPDAARAADIAIRVADAVGFAHARGIVHRDLKPEHIWLGRHGEVTVIDWGLAAQAGGDPRRAGTQGWMAPEQDAGAAADPRMDVWAVGRLLEVMLREGRPRGLAAIARRCMAHDPAQRYADGAAVAVDLRRWLAEGISHAEQPGPLARVQAVLRRSPGLAATAAVGLFAGALAVYLPWREAEAARARAREVVAEITAAPIERASDISASQRRLAGVLAEHPGLPAARLAEARLAAAAQVLADAERQRLLADTLDALDRSFRVRGPWTGEIDQLAATLDHAGVFAMRAGGPCPAESHPEAARLRRALIQLQRARSTAGLPVDPRIGAVLAMCRDPAWAALGRVLAAAEVVVHDLAAPAGADLEAALATAETTDLVLASFAPDARLTQAAEQRLASDPGSFWARVCLARAALGRSAWDAVRSHALVALGRESASLWPRLALGYAALAAADWSDLLVQATHAAAANPAHREAAVMQVIALARLGRVAEAKARLDALGVEGHLRWHQANRQNHPMEQLADAVVEAGFPLGGARPELTPLVPVR